MFPPFIPSYDHSRSSKIVKLSQAAQKMSFRIYLSILPFGVCLSSTSRKPHSNRYCQAGRVTLILSPGSVRDSGEVLDMHTDSYDTRKNPTSALNRFR